MGERILIVMDEGIGNLLALTPALRAIKEHDSSIHITVFCKHVVADLIKESKFVDKVISVLNSDSYNIGFFALWFEGYAAVFIERLAHQCDEVYKIELQTQNIPEYIQYMEIPKIMGYKLDQDFIPEPFVGFPFDFDQPTVALCDTCAPAEAWQRKRWPYYSELAQKLIDDGFQVLIIGADSDRKAFMGNFNDQIIDCIGKFSLRELKFVFQYCQLVIGNDGGIPKLACAMGIPTIFIFGATYIPKNQPIGKNFRVIYLPLDCSPCQYTERWIKCQDFKCMDLLDVSSVYEVAKEVINETNNCGITQE